MVSARWRGSSTSGASGRPCATSQKGQRRVQMSPRIMKVAVPLPKHSAMFGQDASSQTVCSFWRRRMSLISWKREFGLAARTRIHAGLGSGAPRGTMRIVFAWPFSFTPASRMVELPYYADGKTLAHRGWALAKAQIASLRNGQPGITAGVYGGKGREVHVDVECEAMVRPPPRYPYAERRDLGTVHVAARCAGPAHRSAPQQVDHRLFQEADEGLDLHAAAREIDQGVEHDLAGPVVGDLAAAIGGDHRDAVGDAHRRGALSQRVDRCMLEQPELVRRALVAFAREAAHRFQRRQIIDTSKSAQHDGCDQGHSTITTPGWSQSSW